MRRPGRLSYRFFIQRIDKLNGLPIFRDFIADSIIQE